jgi:hypothetical protein
MAWDGICFLLASSRCDEDDYEHHDAKDAQNGVEDAFLVL